MQPLDPNQPLNSALRIGAHSGDGQGLNSELASSKNCVRDEQSASTERPQQFFTVLVVDDSEIDRQTYKRYLAKSALVDCAILESPCGDEGLEMCLQYQPNVVLLDYLLPDTDGVAFLKDLKAQSSQLPAVIMLTGQGNEKIAVRAMKAGAQDYLIKGDLTGDHLVQTIRRVVAQQHLQQQLLRQQSQQRLMADVALKISHSIDLDAIVNTAVEGVRSLLDCDRTVLFQFDDEMKGMVVAESVLPGWFKSLGADVEDTCFRQNGLEKYLSGHKTIIPDIHNGGLSACHVAMLDRFQVRANLVVPILLNAQETPRTPKLWGLLIAHHCRDTREWRADELALLDNLAVQIAIALQQQELVTTLRAQAKTLENRNDRLLETARLLEERNRDLDEFTRVASHDLRAPLRAISNLAGWLKEDLAGEISAENQNSLTLLQKRAKRLDSFVVGLLNYARAGRESIQPQTVQPKELILEVVDTLSASDAFKVSIAKNIPEIYTQKILLHQVFANLIGNAIKYHHESEGTVTITAEDCGRQVAFRVEDDGPGIPTEHHDRIFGVFQTLSSRDDVESTGIGLSIVKKLVERQGGTISVRSTPGKGSAFTFTWPKQSDG